MPHGQTHAVVGLDPLVAMLVDRVTVAAVRGDKGIGVTVAVVVDSAASLPEELVTENGIGVVPMALVVDGELRSESSVEVSELLEWADAGRVTTAAPGPGDFDAAIEAARTKADAVLVLTLSAEMSSSYSAAALAARSHPGTVRVIDTRTAAGGEGLVALAAARAGAEGTLDEAEDAARQVIARVQLVATLDDLDALARSGRVPNLARRARDRAAHQAALRVP